MGSLRFLVGRWCGIVLVDLDYFCPRRRGVLCLVPCILTLSLQGGLLRFNGCRHVVALPVGELDSTVLHSLEVSIAEPELEEFVVHGDSNISLEAIARDCPGVREGIAKHPSKVVENIVVLLAELGQSVLAGELTMLGFKERNLLIAGSNTALLAG